MKKLTSLLICVLIIMSVATVAVSAVDNVNTYDYVVDGVEYTVEFTDSGLSEEKEAIIAERLVSGEEPSVQTYGLGCDLFGHDYVLVNVPVIVHKVNATAPRCREDIYRVLTCEDCDLYKTEIKSSSFIYCCP